jgi:hypothetical protein
VSDIDTAAADSLKALDLEWPIREADMAQRKLESSKMTTHHANWQPVLLLCTTSLRIDDFDKSQSTAGRS